MDGGRFDDLARSFAHVTNRRRFLLNGAALAAAAAGGLVRVSSTEAARRGKPPEVSICSPDGPGGYTRAVVAVTALPGYLATGSVLDNGCCSGADCTGGDGCSTAICDPQTGSCAIVSTEDGASCTPDGPIDLCRAPYTCQQGACSPGLQLICAEVAGGCTRLIGCNPATGQCEYGPVPDGTSCGRGSGCAPGTCAAGVCLDPPERECPSDACKLCGYDACNDVCSCIFIGCGSPVPGCQSAACDPEVGCVFTNINEGGPCDHDQDGVLGLCMEGICISRI